MVWRARAAEHGFSLIESVIACGVLAGSLVALAHVVSIAVTLSDASRRQTTATILAAAKLEELLATTSPVSGADGVDAQGRVVEGDRGVALYVRRWQVVEGAGAPTVVSVVVAPVLSAEGVEEGAPRVGQVAFVGARIRRAP